MKSQATTVKDYLAALPEERRVALEAVRKVILANLDPDYEECMLWGVAAYVVPHRVWPSGHHTDPDKPLMMCGVSAGGMPAAFEQACLRLRLKDAQGCDTHPDQHFFSTATRRHACDTAAGMPPRPRVPLLCE